MPKMPNVALQMFISEFHVFLFTNVNNDCFYNTVHLISLHFVVPIASGHEFMVL